LESLNSYKQEQYILWWIWWVLGQRKALVVLDMFLAEIAGRTGHWFLNIFYVSFIIIEGLMEVFYAFAPELDMPYVPANLIQEQRSINRQTPFFDSNRLQ
jgi:hypothetical protein